MPANKRLVLSRDVRKPDFRICENKDADQLRGHYTDMFSPLGLPLLSKSEISSHLLWLYRGLVCVGPGRTLWSQTLLLYSMLFVTMKAGAGSYY